MATSVRFTAEIEERLDRLAKETGRTKSYYIKELVENHLADLEDCYLAEATLERVRAGKEKTHSSSAARKKLGLAD